MQRNNYHAVNSCDIFLPVIFFRLWSFFTCDLFSPVIFFRLLHITDKNKNASRFLLSVLILYLWYFTGKEANSCRTLFFSLSVVRGVYVNFVIIWKNSGADLKNQLFLAVYKEYLYTNMRRGEEEEPLPSPSPPPLLLYIRHWLWFLGYFQYV